MKNLFFNTPARRRFLKSTNTEYRRILNVLNRFFLAFPQISFTLVNEDEVVLELAKAAQEERIAAVLGPRVQRNLLAVENTGPIRVSGYVGNQDAMRRSRGDQYLFFNRRYFSHKNLHYAVISAYGDVLPRGSYPIYILFIEMSPGEVDVNVHPTKLEIKFANESLVFTSVRGAVKRALTSQEVVPKLTPRSTFAPPAHDLDSPEQPPKPFFFPSGGAGSAERDPSLFVPHHAFERGDVPEARQGQQPERPVFEPTNVWQVHNKYIISQIKNGLIVIDQHVAHERVLYEQAMRNFERRKPSSQQLLFPQVVELSAEDYNLLLEILPFLEQIGFVIKSFSKNTVVVEGVPSGIKISDDEKILLQILDEYKRGKRDSAEIRENVAKSYACHTAIRAGEPLTLEAMNALIDQLFSTNEPYFCPHGRPVLIHIPLDELDRRFRRH